MNSQVETSSGELKILERIEQADPLHLLSEALNAIHQDMQIEPTRHDALAALRDNARCEIFKAIAIGAAYYKYVSLPPPTAKD